MPLFQGFRPVVGTICPSSAAAVVGPPRASQGMKKGRRPRRRPRLKLSDRAGPDQCPVPGENALFPAQIAGFLAVSRPVPVYPVFLNYVVPVQLRSIGRVSSGVKNGPCVRWNAAGGEHVFRCNILMKGRGILNEEKNHSAAALPGDGVQPDPHHRLGGKQQYRCAASVRRQYRDGRQGQGRR